MCKLRKASTEEGTPVGLNFRCTYIVPRSATTESKPHPDAMKQPLALALPRNLKSTNSMNSAHHRL